MELNAVCYREIDASSWAHVMRLPTSWEYEVLRRMDRAARGVTRRQRAASKANPTKDTGPTVVPINHAKGVSAFFRDMAARRARAAAKKAEADAAAASKTTPTPTPNRRRPHG